jgi:hypothetical protein
MVLVRRELSKVGHQYFTFLIEEGCDYLKDYLEERVRREEEFRSLVRRKLVGLDRPFQHI